MALVITVNGTKHTVQSSPDTPLLYVLRNELHLKGPHFGCGLSQCGACAVLLDRKQIRSCVTPVAGVVGHSVTTLEGLPALYAQTHKTTHAATKGGAATGLHPLQEPQSDGQARAAATALHPLQQAWIDEQVPQCGYCQNGMIIQAADLLMQNAHPSDTQIRQAMNGHLCRCGTYSAIIRAIKRAAATMA